MHEPTNVGAVEPIRTEAHQTWTAPVLVEIDLAVTASGGNNILTPDGIGYSGVAGT